MTHIKIIKKRIIKNHFWLGTNSVALWGVTVEKHSIIAVEAIVNSNIESFSIYGGVPAKKIKDISSSNKA